MKAELESDLLDEAVKKLAAEGAAALASHPSPAELFAFAGGELDEPDLDEIREHLVYCRVCSQLVLDARRAADEADEADELPAWMPLPIGGPEAAGSATALGGWRLAAALTISVGAGLLSSLLWPAQVTSPNLLELQAVQVRRSEAAEPLVAPAAARDQPLVVALFLEAAEGPEGELEAQVIAEDDQDVEIRTRIRSSDGIATLALPAGRLASGDYRIELSLPGAAAPASPRIYRFRVLP